jgi:hypothetical protein
MLLSKHIYKMFVRNNNYLIYITAISFAFMVIYLFFDFFFFFFTELNLYDRLTYNEKLLGL